MMHIALYLTRWEESTSEPSTDVNHAPFSGIRCRNCHVSKSITITVANESNRRSKPAWNRDIGGWNADWFSRKLQEKHSS